MLRSKAAEKPGMSPKVRVIDVISYGDDKKRQTNDMLLWDKKMSVLDMFTEYESCVQQNIDATIPRNKIYAMMDEAFAGYEKIAAKGSKYPAYNTCLENLRKEYQALKSQLVVSRGIVEVFLLKLSIIRDLSNGNVVQFGMKDNNIRLLEVPLRSVLQFKSLISAISSPVGTNDYLDINNILPIYSRNGSMGFNTILYAVFNGYFPVGFGEEPHNVHTGIFSNHATQSIQHDYGHALNRARILMKSDPETFQSYKSIYEKLFQDFSKSLISEMELKKDLLMLFILVFELGYSPQTDDKSLEEILMGRAVPLFEADEIFKQFAASADHDPEAMFILNGLVLETIDFVRPLTDVGFQIHFNPDHLYESAEDLRAAFMQLTAEFKKRHPHIILHPCEPKLQKWEPQAKVMADIDATSRLDLIECPEKDRATVGLRHGVGKTTLYFRILNMENPVALDVDPAHDNLETVIKALESKTNIKVGAFMSGGIRLNLKDDRPLNEIYSYIDATHTGDPINVVPTKDKEQNPKAATIPAAVPRESVQNSNHTQAPARSFFKTSAQALLPIDPKAAIKGKIEALNKQVLKEGNRGTHSKQVGVLITLSELLDQKTELSTAVLMAELALGDTGALNKDMEDFLNSLKVYAPVAGPRK
jgi:hypothetical protein